MSQLPRQSLVLPPLADTLRPRLPDPVPKTPALDVPRLRLAPSVVYDADGYPCGDDEPMESQVQLKQVIYAIPALEAYYRSRPDVCVFGNVFINYREGDRNAAVGPDVFVAFGARHREDRPSYKVWEEPVPAFVLEVLSPSTKRRDMETKRDIYRWMGVQEYWLYDPRGEWIEGHVRGHRLTVEGEYEEIAPIGPGRHRSEALGLLLWDEGGNLRFHDPVTGRDLPTREEEVAAREAAEAARESAEARAAREAAARESAEARIAALEALLREHAPPERRE